MMKSMIFNLTLFTPLILNVMLIIFLMLPTKIMKFHPLTLMWILIFTTFLISLKMNFLYNSWMSFLLFLTMIGGLMIIFMYISSLSNNELFFMNFNNIKNSLLKLTIFIMIYLLINNNNYIMNLINLQDLWNNFYNEMYDQMNISTIYKNMINKSTFYLMWYLYFTMICVMNICHKNKFPLRQLKK